MDNLIARMGILYNLWTILRATLEQQEKGKWKKYRKFFYQFRFRSSNSDNICNYLNIIKNVVFQKAYLNHWHF